MSETLNDDYMEVLKRLYYNKSSWSLSEFLQGEMRVLTFISHEEADILPGEIASGLEMTAGRIAGILRSLEKKGLIVRKTYDKDRRKVLVNITEEGRSYSQKGAEALRRHISELTEIMGDDETAALIRSLHILINALEKMENTSRGGI
ncbi:MAG: winged helix DNA-binding protein [Ruminococcus sp.]|nr:winged helix DNA-binding protein [Ruminococcus sp.]